jgi:hypothetical protein
MKNLVSNLFTISLPIFCFITLLILGAEPGTSESSMYEYEHFTDKGNFGWYLVWGWVWFGLITLITFIMLVIDNNKKLTK